MKRGNTEKEETSTSWEHTRSNKRDGSKLAVTLHRRNCRNYSWRYLCYCKRDRQSEREWRSKSLSTGISVASCLRFIRHRHGREKSCGSFSLSPSVPSRGALMALFYLSRPTGERASFELPSLTPGSPDITSTFLDRILWSIPFRSSRLQAQSNPRHRPLSKNFPLASLTKEGRKK